MDKLSAAQPGSPETSSNRVERAAVAVAAVVVLGVVAFYAGRLVLPLPLFASDEAAYLIRALYPDEMVARYPYVATANNGVHLSVIRAVYRLGPAYMVA